MSFEGGSITWRMKAEGDQQVASAVDRVTQKFTGLGRSSLNTLGGLNTRLEKFNERLQRTAIGSRSFQTLQTEIRKTESRIREATGAAQGFGQVFGQLAAAAGSLALFKTIAGNVLEAGIEMEQTRISFQTFMRDVDAGNAVLAQLNEFSNVTPFQNDEVIQAGRVLLAFGTEADNLTHTLEILGNASSATGKDFSDLASIFGKAMAKGTVQAEELNQFAEAGIPILDELGKVMGVSAAEVRRLASAGQITGVQLTEAFENMSAAGGVFEGLMERQSKTLGGLISTLQGKFGAALARVGEMFAKILAPAVEWMIKLWDSLGETGQDIVLTVGIVIGTLGSLAVAVIALKGPLLMLGVLLKGLFLTNPIGIIITAIALAIAGLVAAIVWMNKNWELTKQIFAPLIREFERMRRAFNEIIDAISQRMAPAIEWLKELFSDELIPEDVMENIISFETAFKGLSTAMTVVMAAVRILARIIQTNVQVIVEAAMLIRDAHWMILNPWSDITMDDLQNRLVAIKNMYVGMASGVVDEVRGVIDDVEKIWTARGAEAGEATGNAILAGIEDQVNGPGGIGSTAQEAAGTFATGFEAGLKDNKSIIGDALTDAFGASEGTGSIQGALSGVSSEIGGMMGGAGPYGTLIKGVVDAYLQQMEIGLEAARQKLQQFTGFAELSMKAQSKMFELEIDRVRAAEDEKIRILTESFNTRMGLLDAELAAKIAAIDAEYEAKLERERAYFLSRKEILEENAADAAARRETELLMDSEWAEFQEQMIKDREAAKTDAIKNQNIEKESEQRVHASQVQQIEEQKNAKLEELEKQKAEKEKESKKGVAIFTWLQQSAMLEVEKKIKTAQIWISAAQAAASAMASLSGIPIVGPALGIAMGAKIFSMAGQQVSLVNSQFVMPPAELFGLAGGGVFGGGGSGTSDTAGIYRVSQGEAILTAQQTRAMISEAKSRELNQAVSMMTGSGGQTINVSVHGFVGTRQELVELIAKDIGQLVRGRA